MQVGDHIGPYEIQGSLGHGGMAAVYKGWHTHLHCYHAIKVPLAHSESGVDPGIMLRFLREARLSARLRHSNIAVIHGVSEDNAAQPYFAMEYIEGEDLAKLLASRGKMPLEEALPILRQIGEALDYAHSRPEPVVHRDIKPSNILLEADEKGGWTVKVVDFGIARAQEEAGTRLTRAGMIIGTPEYMSPEQAQTPELVDKRSDIYSFGILVYEMICGKPPFRAGEMTTPISVLMKHAQEMPVPPIEIAPGLSPEANAAILKVLSKNPQDRFDSCAAFVEALSPKVENSDKPVKKLSWLPMGIGALVLAGAVFVFIQSNRVTAGPPAVPAPTCDTAPQCNIAACATSAFCQEVKQHKESMDAAKKAAGINDDNTGARVTLVAQVKSGKLPVPAAQSENEKLNQKAKTAEASALKAITLWPENGDAWYQYYRAQYFRATFKEDYEKILKGINKAEKKFPENKKFPSLEANVKLDEINAKPMKVKDTFNDFLPPVMPHKESTGDASSSPH